MSSVQPSPLTSLHEAQSANGGIWDEVDGQQVVVRFHDESTDSSSSVDEAYNGAALFDRSHWSLLKMTGNDRLDYLHNQTTNDIKALSPGMGCETCIVSPTARLIDLVTVYSQPDSLLLLASPSASSVAFSSLKRLIAFSDAQIADVAPDLTVLTIVGPHSQDILSRLGISLPPPGVHAHRAVDYQGHVLHVATGTGLAIEGFTLIVPSQSAGSIWKALVDHGATPKGTDAWETLRILQGRPALGKELANDFNPLEAGLWHTTSFTKGCYIGQETIARLDTYNGVKQQLWGVELNTSVPLKTTIHMDEQRIGILTSMTASVVHGSYRGLAFIKTKHGGAGLEIELEGAEGKTVATPYNTREKQVEAV